MINIDNFNSLAKKFESKLKPIKVFLTDADGVLTAGRSFYMGEEVGFNRFFNLLDGYGLKVLQSFGIKVGFISGGNSLSLYKRAESLKLDFAYFGHEDKRSCFLDVLEKTKTSPDEILYIGDELFDIPLLKKAGFSAAPPHASLEVKAHVDYITQRQGGKGCVREVIDILRIAQKISPEILDFDESR